MQLNKLGHGLAVSAVSALVITGLTLSASPALAADGSGVRLISQLNGIASTSADFSDNSFLSVTLTAEQLDPSATVSFEVNSNPAATDTDEGWTAVTTASPLRTQGRYVTVEWTPNIDNVQVETAVALRAVATTDTTTTYSTRNDVTFSQENEAVAVESVTPFFDQPYADSSRTGRLLAVSGTTSTPGGTVELWRGTRPAARSRAPRTPTSTSSRSRSARASTATAGTPACSTSPPSTPTRETRWPSAPRGTATASSPRAAGAGHRVGHGRWRAGRRRARDHRIRHLRA